LILKQYYLGCLAHASYLVADENSGRAAVVDPQRDVDQYLNDAERRSCRIEEVFLTHFHADFVAGHLELRERTGATIRLGARASAEYPFEPMQDGSVVRLGDVVLEVLETPGHSPESISILVYDQARREGSDEPYAVLTGDTLFIDDVGRPDLRASLGWNADDLAGMLYDSIQRLAGLPDRTLVYPGHGAGSLCGRSMSTETISTIGAQRLHNYAMAPMSRERFTKIVTADLPDAPPYFTYDAILNTRLRPTLTQALERELTALSLDDVIALVRDGAQLLDARDAPRFESAHLRGSINVGLGGSFASWCGTLLERDRPIVLVTEPGHEAEAATRLGRIGFDNVAGYLDGGMQSLTRAPDELIADINRVTAPSLAEELASGNPPLVVDVRTPGEWEARRIDSSVNVPLSRLADQLATLPAGDPIVVHCTSGYRSAIAASVIRRAGLDSVSDLVGGLDAWEAAELATVP
jgi:glyoxylase-like metal-dependent hydrolase (beta-lactamase superfamily II)/rhodanese-related sulfurtransferase